MLNSYGYLACSQDINALPEKVAYENAKSRHDELKLELDEATFDEKHRMGMDEEDRMNLLFEFAKLLSEPKLDFETQKQYLSRAGRDPFFLGVVKIKEESDDMGTIRISDFDSCGLNH